MCLTDGQKGGRTEGGTDRRAGGRTDRRAGGRTDRRADEQKGGRTEGRTDRRADGQKGGQTEGRTNKRADGQKGGRTKHLESLDVGGRTGHRTGNVRLFAGRIPETLHRTSTKGLSMQSSRPKSPLNRVHAEEVGEEERLGKRLRGGTRRRRRTQGESIKL
eukprot:SAG11_NODE_273_length_11315_cov_38.599412_1_plen_161_part_00